MKAGVIVLVAFFLMILPVPAAGGLSPVPLPEILTDPNEGNTYGFLPVLLVLDPDERIEAIIAHDVRWNRITGWYPAFRLLGYPELGHRYAVVLRKSEKIDEDYLLEYEAEGMLDGVLDVFSGLTFFQDSRLRFYGFGNDTEDDTESNFTEKLLSFIARFRFRPTDVWVIGWQTRLQDAGVEAGGVEDLPFVAELFPGTPGLEDVTIHGQQFSIAYDDRDSSMIPRQGFLGRFAVEIVDRRLGSDRSYVKYDFDLRGFVPVRERMTLALRGGLHYVGGAGQAPFYERSILGGSASLRGFGDGRFTDDHSFHGTAELRTIVIERHIFGVFAELELAPFVDLGQVFADAATVPLDDLHPVGGLGFRGIVRPQVVGYVDVGFGTEGVAVFTGLDYPF